MCPCLLEKKTFCDSNVSLFDGKSICLYCRDAKHMARDVHSALVSVLEKYLASGGHQDNNISSPEELLQLLKEERRYLVDAWS